MTDQQQKALRLLGLAAARGFWRSGKNRSASPAAAAERSFYWLQRMPAIIPSAGRDPLFRAENARISVCRIQKMSWETDWAAMPVRCAHLPIPRLQNRFLRHWAMRHMLRSWPS